MKKIITRLLGIVLAGLFGTTTVISQTMCVHTGSPGSSSGITTSDFAQSITMNGGCTGEFAGLSIYSSATPVDASAVWRLDIYQGDGFGGTLQYSQTGISLTQLGSYLFIKITGGSGSRAFITGNQYTFRVSTTSPTNSVTVFRNTTSFYADGQAYDNGTPISAGGDFRVIGVYAQTTAPSCGAATRLYVKHNASGANDGTSWTNAYTSLQSAIDYARGCSNIQEIWVAAGTYKPSKDKTGNASPGNPKNKTFYVNFPVDIYGGFAGTESMLSQRNITSNPTILSGDIDNNDSANPAVTATDVQGANSSIVLHIQDVADGVIADGFTITAGQLFGFSGGGIHNEGTGFPFACNATIRNCKIQGNAGAAVFNSGNLGSSSGGKAILLLENSTISGNSEDVYAAGIYSNSNGGKTITTVNNCTFSNNTSTGTSNGGAYNEYAQSGNGEATFSKCIFRDNSATSNGAAVHANGSFSGILNHSFTNCIFMNNTAGNKGGAYYANGASSGRITSTFTNCTFYNNAATNGGSAVYHTTSVAPTSPMLLRNCILWQNTNEILLEGMATMTLSYSLINGTSAPSGASNDNSLFNVNPNFVDAAGGNLRLQNCSSAFNAGTSTGVPSTDLDNNPRPAQGGYDMGAYESQTAPVTTTYYRDQDGDGFGNPSVTQTACTQPSGYVTNNTDCNDNNININPGATEICDGIDNNCDGITDGSSVCPDYNITTTAGAMVITDGVGNGETLNVSQNSTNIRFDVTGRTYSLNGGATLNFPVDIALASANSITINTAVGNDIINIGAFSANLPSLTINGGVGNDQVNFNGDITFANNANLDVDLQNDDATPGTDQVSFTNNANLVLSGTGAAVIKVSRNITFSSGTASLETTNGNLTLEANQQTTASTGNFIGVAVSDATIRVNGTGTLTIKGKSGNDSVVNQFGVHVQSGGLISGGTSATATIEGSVGAASANGNVGVNVAGTNARISSLGANVSVVGAGGSTGTSSTCRGVAVNMNGTITAGGSGTVSVSGTGGAGSGNFNAGVYVAGSATTLITSSGGNVSVTGIGGGTGLSVNNYGIWQELGGTITAGGTGSVTVNGTGGASSGGSNFGIYVTGATTVSQITSSGGNVSVTGQGGGTGSSQNNYGILLFNSARIVAGNSGTLMLNGTGGPSTGSNNHGVYVANTSSLISSAGGNVTINGTGGGTSTSHTNIGVYVNITGSAGSNNISAGGTGTLTINGMGGPASGSGNHGVQFNGLSLITSGGGNINITGVGGSAALGIVHDGASTVTTAINGGNINFVTNEIFIASSSTVSTNNSSSTTLRQHTNGVQIDLGSTNDIPGTLQISDAELDRITTGTLIIGNANSGNITVSAAISRSTRTNVQLVSAGDVLISGGGFNTDGGTMLLDPGTSPAAVKPTFNGTDVTASTLSFASDLSIAINGTTAGDGTGSTYTQLNVAGAVNLTGVDLLFTGAYVPTGNEVFTILVNDGADAIVGTFTGLAQGATIANFRGSGLNATISYVGGTGNDVVITLAGPDINIKGNGLSILDGDTAPRIDDGTYFGNIDIYSTDPVVHTFTIENTGTTNLVIPVGGITKSGSSDFGIGTVSLPFTIAPGDFATFPVLIDASGNGVRTATVSIQSNDADESPYTFVVRAVGVAPEINVSGLGVDIVSGDNTPSTSDDTDFGSVDVDGGSVSHTFTIQNTNLGSGDLYLNAGAITITGTHASDFSISGITLPNTVSPGQSVTFVVTFNPSAVGTRNATVRIANNDLSESTYLFDIGGVGILPDYTITTTGNVLTITDVAGNGEALNISQNGTNIRFNVTGRTYSLNGAATQAFTTPADVALADITSIVVNTATGNDNINVGAFTANLPSLTINGGTGNDEVFFSGDITFAANASLDVDLQNDEATSGTDVFVIGGGANLLLSGTGTVNVKVSHFIRIEANGSIETQNGMLTLEANQQTTSTTGFFIGLKLFPGALVRSVNGNLALAGTGGTDNNLLIHGIENLGTISTTGTGDILLLGTGGSSGDDNDGVRNGGSVTATGSGDIQIRGFSSAATAFSEGSAHQSGGSVTTTSGDINIYGDLVFLDSGSSVSAGTNKVTIVPTTSGRIIDLGSDDTATQLGLIDAELDRITAGTLVIGNSTSGAITVSQAITRPSSTNVQLISAGDVLISGGGFNTAGGTLLLDPGTSPAAVKPSFNGTDVTASTLSFASDLQIVINGATPGDGTGSTYSQLNVAGAVNLTGVDLLFAGTYIPTSGNIFTIVVNDGTDAIVGTFTGLAEGATLPNFRGSGFNATISYVGGTGNDVVISICTLSTWYRDADNDGFGNPAVSQQACSQPTGYVTNNTDCDDNDALEKPGQVWYADVDNDGYSSGTTLTQCLRPVGYKVSSELTATSGDCNDNNFAIKPTATEICDGIDNNCNGSTDEGVTTTYYADADGDGFGNPAVSQQACSQPTGYVTNNTDCDDNDALEKPGQVWYADVDNDGYSSGTTLTQCLRPVGYKVSSELTATSGDCNDNNFAIKPTATEICDGIDNNCNGSTDEGGLTTYYADADGDGFGNPAVSQQACSQPTGYVTNNTDCDDNDALEKPGQVWYKDTDNDGYAQTGAATITQCLRPAGYKLATELTSTTGDCNDANQLINPTATEICDGIDNNCNGSTDEGVTTTYYADADGDGFGNPALSQQACSQPMGYVLNNTDCDDNDALEKPGQVWYADVDNDGYSSGTTLTQCLRPVGYKVSSELTATSGDCNDNNFAIKPTATEICDGIDNNCNGSTDEGVTTTYYADADGDGFGNPAVSQQACSQPTGYVTNNTDCDDNDALEKPGQVWYADVDNDGYSSGTTLTQCLRPVGYKVSSELTSTTGDCNDANQLIHPGATEICDGIDNNCNGSTDEGGLTTYYADADGDGFGNPAVSQQACSQPTGYVLNNTDCDDNDALEKPGQVWYKDTDNDGYAQTGAATITQCLRPVGYKLATELTSTTGDCNDANQLINPTATEICDGIDNNCNGSTDEGVTTTYYADADGDGFGNPAVSQQACSQPTGYVTNNTDCDDNDALEKPGQVWYADVDNDGYSTGTTLTQCLRPVGYKLATELTSTTGDCNDANQLIHPGATEVCDGIDNNCNGSTDEGGLTTYYADADGDGFGNPTVSQQACSQPTGYVLNNTDCDDNDALEKPGQVWYKDTDNDGYAQTGAATITQCLRPVGYKVSSELTSTTGDCNDANQLIHPGATEVCDGIDNNCNGSTDEGVTTTYYADADNDGFGNPAVSQQACSQPTGYVTNNTDCDDNDALEKPGQVWYADVDNDGYSTGTTLTQCLRPVGYKVSSELTSTTGDCNDANQLIHPGATEVCDGIDNNCNGSTDEGVTTTYYADADNDGFGNPAVSQQACSQPTGYVLNNTDCDDNDALEKPGQVWYKDTDNDGYAQTGAATITQCLRPVGYKLATELTSTTGDCNDANQLIHPGATEVCDGIDNNCNGSTDEGVTTTYYADADGDGFGNPAVSQQACSQPTGYVTNSTDCDDNDALEKPGQVWYADVDNDGYSTGTTLTQCLRPVGYKVSSELTSTTGDCNDANQLINPTATEICDGIDNNCNGSTDETPTCANYAITTTGGNVIITDITGTGETLEVSENSGKIRFNVTGKTYSIDGGPTTAFTTPAEVALSGKTSITINTATGNDIINVGAFTTQLPTLTINGGTGDDQVNMNGNLTFISNANLDLDLQNDDANPGTDEVTIGANASLSLSGTGIVTVKASKSIVVNAGAGLSANNTIWLVTNSIDIKNAAAINANASSILLRPYTNGIGIDLGAATNPLGGPLSLSDDELDRVTAGMLIIGDANSGAITVSSAISRAAATNMSLTTSGAVHLNASALSTNGGNLAINAAAGINPTAAGTDVNVGTVSFTSGNDLAISINGTTADTDYRQLKVEGSANLSGLDLVLSGTHVPVLGQTFVLVNNDGSDAIQGTFNGLPEGATIAPFLGSQLNARISYVGGDGNDAVLTVIASVELPTNTANVTICKNATASLTASCAVGQVTWYNSAGTTQLFVGSPFVTPTLATSTGYKVRCEQAPQLSGFVDVLVTVIVPPTITLTTLQQTLNEGNNPVLCDTDANPVNSLQFNVLSSCVSGSPVWRVQVSSGAWSTWSATAPVSQSSNNQLHRYQAACDANCASTYSGVIELTINNRASVPQNVSLLVDGVTVAAGETKEVCSLVNMPLTFNANCAANEVVLYSVDGGEYSAGVPVGLVDNQYHNYRVRCRKSDGTPSCVESESGVMRLKLVIIPSAPTVSLSSTSSCNPSASFSGQSTCGSLRTVWYNATTNVALPSLPSTVPSQTTSYYARCQTENGCLSEKSNVVTFTLTPTQVAPVITASQEIVCTGTTVTISANCPAGSQTFWNTGVTAPSFTVAFSNVTKQTYWAKCIFEGGCQSAESIHKDIYWNAFVVTLINIGESKSAVKSANDKSLWTNQFITRDGGPELEQSTQVNPTLFYVENVNKIAPRYWTINVEACGLSTDGSLTFDMLATPEMGVIRSFNTHENNAPYFMYANREGWTELYAQNHPAYGFYQDNGAGGNVYDTGLPKGLYKLGIRYWDQKGWGSIYPSTRQPQGNVLAYQEYWFRIQSKDGVGIGAAREMAVVGPSHGKGQGSDNGKQLTDNGAFATVIPNPVTNILRLKVAESKGQTIQTSLTDASGREVLHRQFVPETNTHQEEFGVSELPAGMYFLKVTTAQKQATLKVVKVE